jgi:hypothetical protein
MFMTSSFAFWIEPRPVELKYTSYHIRTATSISMRWRTRNLLIHKSNRRAAWIVRPMVEDSGAIRASFKLIADEALLLRLEARGRKNSMRSSE